MGVGGFLCEGPKVGLLQLGWVTCPAKITLGPGLPLSLPPSPSYPPAPSFAKAKARNNPSQSPGCCCAINSKSSVTITQEKKQKEKGVWETGEASMYAMRGPHPRSYRQDQCPQPISVAKGHRCSVHSAGTVGKCSPADPV